MASVERSYLLNSATVFGLLCARFLRLSLNCFSMCGLGGSPWRPARTNHRKEIHKRRSELGTSDGEFGRRGSGLLSLPAVGGLSPAGLFAASSGFACSTAAAGWTAWIWVLGDALGLIAKTVLRLALDDLGRRCDLVRIGEMGSRGVPASGDSDGAAVARSERRREGALRSACRDCGRVGIARSDLRCAGSSDAGRCLTPSALAHLVWDLLRKEKQV